MTKKELEEKRELARVLYMSGEQQNVISERIHVSKTTVNNWVEKGGWKELRAAQAVTRPELVNKLLRTINTLIESVNASDDPNLIAGLGDKLAKLSSVIEKLDKKANIVDTIEVFMAFSKWLEYRMEVEKKFAPSESEIRITPELLKMIHHYQDLYISDSFKV